MFTEHHLYARWGNCAGAWQQGLTVPYMKHGVVSRCQTKMSSPAQKGSTPRVGLCPGACVHRRQWKEALP